MTEEQSDTDKSGLGTIIGASGSSRNKKGLKVEWVTFCVYCPCFIELLTS